MMSDPVLGCGIVALDMAAAPSWPLVVRRRGGRWSGERVCEAERWIVIVVSWGGECLMLRVGSNKNQV